MKNLTDAKQIIYSYDLSDVIDRLVVIDGWKRKHALEACHQYRHFLFLKLKYGSEYELPPSYEADEVWHAHILHTEDYMTFCHEVYGEYLHHHPHTRKNTLSKRELAELFEKETQTLYYQEFGEYMFAIRPLSLKRRIGGIIQRIISIRTFYKKPVKVE